MNLQQTLKEMRDERDLLDQAILSFERLAAGGKRRGRPPAWMKRLRRKPDGLATDGRDGKTGKKEP